MVVIVTDGRPQDRVAEVAAEAREKGIEIYAVGVARADMTSLRAMASPPFEDHVFLVESFDLIHQFGLQFQDKLCGKTGNDITVCKTPKHTFGIFIITFAKNTFQITTGSFFMMVSCRLKCSTARGLLRLGSDDDFRFCYIIFSRVL